MDQKVCVFILLKPKLNNTQLREFCRNVNSRHPTGLCFMDCEWIYYFTYFCPVYMTSISSSVSAKTVQVPGAMK